MASSIVLRLPPSPSPSPSPHYGFSSQQPWRALASPRCISSAGFNNESINGQNHINNNKDNRSLRLPLSSPALSLPQASSPPPPPPPPLPPPPINASLSSVLPYLWSLAVGDRTLGWRLFAALLLLIGGKGAGLAGPVLLKWAMDKLQTMPYYMHDQSRNIIVGALVLSALSKAVSAGLNEMRYVVFAPLGHATGRRVAVHLLDHILGLDLTFYLERSTGVLARIIDRAQRSVVHIFRAVGARMQCCDHNPSVTAKLSCSRPLRKPLKLFPD